MTDLTGIRESNAKLSQPLQWNLVRDKQLMSKEQLPQLARCTKITPSNEPVDTAKYATNAKQIAKKFIGRRKIAPTDIQEGMQVGVGRAMYAVQILIQIALPSQN